MKRPHFHIAVEIGEIWVFPHRLKERLPIQPAAEHPHQRRLADPNIACDNDKFFQFFLLAEIKKATALF